MQSGSHQLSFHLVHISENFSLQRLKLLCNVRGERHLCTTCPSSVLAKEESCTWERKLAHYVRGKCRCLPSGRTGETIFTCERQGWSHSRRAKYYRRFIVYGICSSQLHTLILAWAIQESPKEINLRRATWFFPTRYFTSYSSRKKKWEFSVWVF